MGKPAARIGDMHTCPKVSPGTGVPHVGGVIIGAGCGTVLIEGVPAATMGDPCTCAGEPDEIIQGSAGVFIEGKPAARSGDRCAHGGSVTGGCGSVLIGEGRRIRVKKLKAVQEEEEWKEPSGEEKVEAINKAIKDAIELLTGKLWLMENNDVNTIENFKKWFGHYDDAASKVIQERTKRVLAASMKLSIDNFIDRTEDNNNKKKLAEVYPLDCLYRIYVTDEFWKAKPTGQESKAGTIIHELSHFKDIGDTKDYVYKNLSLVFAKSCPKDALNNAANYELFMVS